MGSIKLVANNGIQQHYVIILISRFELLSGLCLPVQYFRAAETHRVGWGLGRMVPVSGATGAVGPGRCCGHRSVCAGNSVSGRLRSAVWMLLWPRRKEPEEEVEKWGDLDAYEVKPTHTVK